MRKYTTIRFFLFDILYFFIYYGIYNVGPMAERYILLLSQIFYSWIGI